VETDIRSGDIFTMANRALRRHNKERAERRGDKKKIMQPRIASD
jgi:hypothetical protein